MGSPKHERHDRPPLDFRSVAEKRAQVPEAGLAADGRAFGEGGSVEIGPEGVLRGGGGEGLQFPKGGGAGPRVNRRRGGLGRRPEGAHPYFYTVRPEG